MNLANAITALRIVLSLALIALPTFSMPFLAVYALCGLTDMVDGPIARKTGTASDFGAKLDSVADLVFVVVVIAKVAPMLQIHLWIWICIGAIVLVKVVNLVSGIAAAGEIVLPHTTANKAAGLVLFLTIFLLAWKPIALVCAPGILISGFAAIQEGHLIRTAALSEQRR